MPTPARGDQLIRRLIWALVAVFISGMIGTTASIAFTIQKSRQICELLNIIDAQDNPPPTNERQQKIADAIHRYRLSIGCKEDKK